MPSMTPATAGSGSMSAATATTSGRGLYPSVGLHPKVGLYPGAGQTVAAVIATGTMTAA